MILIIAIALLLALLVILSIWLSSGVSISEAWIELAPNIAAELLGLIIALLIAEVVIRRFRHAHGAKQLAPFAARSVGVTINFCGDLVRKLEYTPNEFKGILKEYIEGKYDPVHIPANFKKKLAVGLKATDQAAVDKAVAGIEELDEIVAKFAGSLEAEHVLFVERAKKNWNKFRTEFQKPEWDQTALAEAYLDAHDDAGDLFTLFSVPEYMKRQQRKL